MRKKVHVSNLVFFYDGVEWVSYTPSQVSEGIHTASKESKREEIAKKSAESAEAYEWVTEWSLYEDIYVRSNSLTTVSERGFQISQCPFSLTYDKKMGKFIGFVLCHSHNFFLVDNLVESIPKTMTEAPSTQINSFAELTEVGLNLLTWVNERRFSMPWRWSLWSQTFSNVLKHFENGGTFLHEVYLEPTVRKSSQDTSDEAKKNLIKRAKKRLQILKEREMSREFYRLDQPIANNE